MGLCPLPHCRLRNLCCSGWSETATMLGQALSQHWLAALGCGFVPQFPCFWGVRYGEGMEYSCKPGFWGESPWKRPGSILAVVPLLLAIFSPSKRPSEGLHVPFQLPVRRISGGISARQSRLYQCNEEQALAASKPPATGGHQQNLTKRLR